MGQYRKKPVTIEAVHCTSIKISPIGKWDAEFDEPLPDWMRAAIAAGNVAKDKGAIWPALDEQKLMIGTLEGQHEVSIGDWIVRGVKGELYPVKPDIFEATYEPVDLCPV